MNGQSKAFIIEKTGEGSVDFDVRFLLDPVIAFRDAHFAVWRINIISHAAHRLRGNGKIPFAVDEECRNSDALAIRASSLSVAKKPSEVFP